MVYTCPDRNFDEFINYPFTETCKNYRLGIIKDHRTGVKHLSTFNKDAKTIKHHPKDIVSDSLSKIVQYIKTHHTTWYNNYQDQQGTLRLQCAWLDKKVQEHNRKWWKKHIHYNNPYRKRQVLQLSWKHIKQPTYLKIASKKVNKSFSFDELTSYEELTKKFDQLVKRIHHTKLELTLTCGHLECPKQHHVLHLRVKKVFSSFEARTTSSQIELEQRIDYKPKHLRKKNLNKIKQSFHNKQ
jgi:hypothetical protein